MDSLCGDIDGGQRYAGERAYREQANYCARIILAVLLAVAIWTPLMLIEICVR